MKTEGLVHLYCGDGKGKTTAAMGLAVRALGSGMTVTVVQFLKSGDSGELEPLRRLGARIFSGRAPIKFVSQMTTEERAEAKVLQTGNLRAALELSCDLLILDEACAAWSLDMVDRPLLRQAVLQRPVHREIVLTGRDPADWMREAADYCTEMCCRAHPYQNGLSARRGIEY
jgi:cob(I)alamin adenosyltransferase